jgi:hypothetical protein
MRQVSLSVHTLMVVWADLRSHLFSLCNANLSFDDKHRRVEQRSAFGVSPLKRQATHLPLFPHSTHNV